MAEQNDVHIGNQLFVSSALPGMNESPFLPGRDPTCLGIGPSAIPGSIYASGCVLIGNPTAYPIPEVPEATVMIARPNVLTNPLAAKCIGLLKVTNKGLPPSPPTPFDVMFGDPAVGMVGISVNSVMINVINASFINIISPTMSIFTNKFHVGTLNEVGAKLKTGVAMEAGAKCDAGARTEAGPAQNSSPTVAPIMVAPLVKGKIFTGKALIDKGFDIAHPTREGKRLRHICVEGPESAIYIRGRLEDSKIIEVPEYWDGLVDYDSITVTLTAVGKPQHLYVKSIDKNQIMIDNRKGDECLPSCHYEVWANRIGPPLITEYDGDSPADYPGDQSGHSIAGYNYDVRNELTSDDYPGDDSIDAVSNFDENP